MVRDRRHDSSVIFIGEDEEPLLKEAWGDRKPKGRSKNGKPGSALRRLASPSKARRLPATFFNYLFSEKSVITRLVTSLFPPFGRYKRIPVDAEGSFLSCFLLVCTLYWGYVNAKGEPRVNALFLSSSLTVGYLITVSSVTWLLSFCTKTIITLR